MKVRALLCLTLSAWLAGTAGAELPPPDSYEGHALERALDQLELEVEPAPEGKTLDRIWVVNLEVFGPRDNFLQWFNIFHRTTRWRQIEREVILRPGQVWDETKIWETERKLRDPLFTTLVVIVPVKSARAGMFDLLVVTRDVWSLRFNSNFEIQENRLTELTLSISENNFLGLRKQVAIVFDMNQGNFFVGPLYVDKNVAGTRMRLTTNGGPLFSRETGELEGSRSSTVLTYPFWSLDSKWGGGLSVSHFDGKVRSFLGTDLRTVCCAGGQCVPPDPTTGSCAAGQEAVPYLYDQRNIEVNGSVTRSYGREIIQRVSLGYEVESQRPELPSGFAFSDAVADAFRQDVLPRSERTSSLYGRYNLFTPRFTAYRNIDTYDLREDARLGPDLQLTGGAALELLGSESNFLFASASATYTHDLREDGYARVGAAASTRIESGDLIDNRVDGVVEVISPRFGNLARFAGRVLIASRIRERQNRFLTLGGRNGLRGYRIGAFTGQRLLVGNAELRSMPVSIWFSRVGATAFYDVGHAADRLGELSLKHDVGIGLRWLLPQLSPLVYRLDWAVPLNGATAGFPGRVILGVDQVF
jgi:hypothetical protein